MTDKIDEKILLELVKNSRIPITQLAKKIKISREMINYRINKLKKEGVIRDFIADINLDALRYTSALFFVSIKADSEKEFIDYISSLDYVSWAGTHCGFWSLGMAIYGKDVKDVEQNFQHIFDKYQDSILEHKFEFYKTSNFFYEKYFGGKTLEIETNTKQYKIDNYDKIILKILSKNSRVTSVELAQTISLSPIAIAQRIKRLEKNNYILKYTIYINPLKIGLFQYYFFIKNNNLNLRKQLYAYLKSHSRVCSLLDYFGDPFIEFGIFVSNPYEVREIIQEIKQKFPQTELIDYFMSQEDFISYGLPEYVFK